MTETCAEFTCPCGQEELRRGFAKHPLIPSFQLTNQIKYFPFSGEWVSEWGGGQREVRSVTNQSPPSVTHEVRKQNFFIDLSLLGAFLITKIFLAFIHENSHFYERYCVCIYILYTHTYTHTQRETHTLFSCLLVYKYTRCMTLSFC